MKKLFTKSISLFLVIVLSFGCFSLVANAEETIYYSDLFYKYDPSYLTNYIKNYKDNNFTVLTSVYNTYLDSEECILTAIKTGINTGTDLKSTIKFLADCFGADLQHNDALKAANLKFVQKMFSEYDTVTSVLGADKKIVKNANSIVKAFKALFEQHNAEELNSELFGAMLETLQEQDSLKIFKCLGDDKIKEVINYDTISELTSTFSEMASFLEITEALFVAISIENMRMEIIEDIIANCNENSELYNGMTLLRRQLIYGWKSYFLENYGTSFVLKELVGLVKKAFPSGQTVSTGFFGTAGAVCAILKVASWITFDVILDVPDTKDVITQQILTNYVAEIYEAMKSKAHHRGESGNETNLINSYETMFMCLKAAVDAGLDASEKMLVSENEPIIDNIRYLYRNFSYGYYIDCVKTTLSNIPESERQLKSSFTYRFTNDVKFSAPTDEVEANTAYCCENNIFEGNVEFLDENYSSFQLNSDSLTINGNVVADNLTIDQPNIMILGDLTAQKLKIIELGFSVKGLLTAGTLFVNNLLSTPDDIVVDRLAVDYLEIGGGSFSCVGGADIRDCYLNNCSLTVGGNLNVDGVFSFANSTAEVAKNCNLGDNTYGVLYMATDSDYLFVGGDLKIAYSNTPTSGYWLTTGTVELKGDFLEMGSTESGYNSNYYYEATGRHKTIFSGSTTQTIHFDNPGDHNHFNKVVFENENIKCETPIYSMELTQDTILTKTDNLDVEHLWLKGNDLSTKGDITVGELYTEGGSVSCTEDADIGSCYLNNCNLTVGGNLKVDGCFDFINSTAEVAKNCTLGDNTRGWLAMDSDNDYLFVGGNLKIAYSDTLNTSYITAGTVEIKGDFLEMGNTEKQTSYNYYYCATGTHKTIFSGSTTQTIHFDNPGDHNHFNKVVCFKNSIVSLYCQSNGIPYETLDIGRTINSKIDYSNKVVLTNSKCTTDYTKLASFADSATVATQTNNGYYGTGAKLSLLEGDALQDEYTVVVSGDLDGDSVCDVLDAVYTERIVNTQSPATFEQIYAANSGNSNVIDVSSYQNVVNQALAS